MEKLDNTESKNELLLEAQAELYLRETSKWAKFLSIVGFVFMGIMVLIAVIIFAFAGTMGSMMPFPMSLLGLVYLLIALLYCIPIYFLLSFSNKAKAALISRSSATLSESMKYLKSHYKFIGIFTIVMLAMYPIGIVIAIIIGASQGF
ncbi:hypothetical protein [Labilibaculum sp.]|uniref:hypothetical protein n=1 Tax=Labilibaculum sp. TaxID=2060723 RepID=UPI00356295D6